MPPTQTIAYEAYKTVRPNDEPAFSVDLIYFQMQMMAIGIQMAGPNLTPANFEKGMFAYPSRLGPIGTWGFKPNDYTAADDVREIYWDPNATSNYNGKKGAYIDPQRAPVGSPARFRPVTPRCRCGEALLEHSIRPAATNASLRSAGPRPRRRDRRRCTSCRCSAARDRRYVDEQDAVRGGRHWPDHRHGHLAARHRPDPDLPRQPLHQLRVRLDGFVRWRDRRRALQRARRRPTSWCCRSSSSAASSSARSSRCS